MEQAAASGGKAKFMINIQFEQNATWRGTIQWIDKNRTQIFRSELEMLRLMDEALGSGERPQWKPFSNEDS